MKTNTILFTIAIIALTITSCKKEKAVEPVAPGPTQPTSNYYVFDGVTYTAGPFDLGWGAFSNQFNFFCDPTGNKDMRLFFQSPYDDIEPKAGTYAVIPNVNSISDSTTCSIKLVSADSTIFQSTGGGIITVGKSGTKTTYQFSDIPLTGGKNVSGDFIY